MYVIDGNVVDLNREGVDKILLDAHTKKHRPLCMCRKPGVPMYLAKIEGKVHIKRMPNSGMDHSPDCESYEPPAELSGLGQVMGSAIQENPEDGITTLKLEFSLSKAPGKAPPTPSGAESDSVKTDGNKLSLRGTLNYLYEAAGFNKWTPAMRGKRNYSVFRKYFTQATDDKKTKGGSLSDALYVPEAFSVEQKDAIAQRRTLKLGKIASSGSSRKLMILVGEIKGFAPARYGQKVVFKHCADFPFMLNDDIYNRLHKRFAAELNLWDAFEDTHLLAIATFGVGSTGVASIEEVALMICDENWIPFENTHEKELISSLIESGRSFIKGLRYNLPSTTPLASLVLTDTEPLPTAMYAIPPGASESFTKSVDGLIEESKLQSWRWAIGDEAMPAIPCMRSRVERA